MRRKDQEIKNEIIDQLVWDSRVDASNVMVSVTEGVVTLDGTVQDFLGARTVEDVVRNTEGVLLVENRISLDPEVRNQSDEQIRATVMRTLSELCRLGPEDLSVSVADGHVTLEGTVPSLWIQERAGNLASLVCGVTGLTNKLAVMPQEGFDDAAVAAAVKSAIGRKLGPGGRNVTVRAENGAMTLAGSVESPSEREIANQAAMQIRGVHAVRGQIVVQ